MVHEQKFKDLSSKWQVSVERIVLDLESEESEFYNPNLHNIARSDRIGFTTKTRLKELTGSQGQPPNPACFRIHAFSEKKLVKK